MIRVTMNDAAADLLHTAGRSGTVDPVGELAPGLAELLARGIERHGEVIVFARHAADAALVDVGDLPFWASDLTGWECGTSSFHLEDVVPVDVTVVDCVPEISLDDQRVLLRHGLAFGIALARLAAALDEPAHIMGIVSTNETNGTFRFHQVRPGEGWLDPELDRYSAPVIAVESPRGTTRSG